MKLAELKEQMRGFLYLEDTGVIDIALAATLATRLQLGNPVWLVVIGVSSSGKSQIIRPLATDGFVHRVDDLTENTLISGQKSHENSLLLNVGPLGVLLISDLTVVFSKNTEARDAILGQLRMVYDGEFTKYFGNRKPITWRGSLGVIAGCTPSVYRHFESIADMGERFIYYRMKPLDAEKAVTKSLENKLYGKALDEALAEGYREYQKAVVTSLKGSVVPPLTPEVSKRIMGAAMFAARMRTPIHLDKRTSQVDRIPFPEMPMRVALQLGTLARALMAMQYHETGSFDLPDTVIKDIEWCAYSLANEERRAILRVLAGYTHGLGVGTQEIGDKIGLATEMAKMHLQQLASIGLVVREGEGAALTWRIPDEGVRDMVRHLEGIKDTDLFAKPAEDADW